MKKLFSLFALVGAFVACQPEELETAFDVDPAKATINVTVIDVQTAEPIEGLEVTFPGGEGEVDGNVVTINGNLVAIDGNVVTITGKPAIQAMDVKLILSSSKYPDESKEVSVKVNSLLAGGVATYNVVEVMGTPYPEPGPDPEPEPEPVVVTVEKGTSLSVTEVGYLSTLDVEGHSHSHNGIDLSKWAENPTPFMITVSGTYSVFSGVEAEKTSVTNPDYESLVQTYVDSYNSVGQKEEKEEFSFNVSAWALYTVWQTKTTETTEYVVKVDGEEVGTFNVEGVSSTQVEYLEMALPGHSHDYVHGHGHASHGEHDNAGGGIVFAE